MVVTSFRRGVPRRRITLEEAQRQKDAAIAGAEAHLRRYAARAAANLAAYYARLDREREANEERRLAKFGHKWFREMAERDQQALVFLMFVEGLSFKEIGREVGVSHQRASRLCYAVDAAGRVLADLWFAEPKGEA